jgi:hypothetical protein
MQLGTGMNMVDNSQKTRNVEKKIDDKQASDGCREKPV